MATKDRVGGKLGDGDGAAEGGVALDAEGVEDGAELGAGVGKDV